MPWLEYLHRYLLASHQTQQYGHGFRLAVYFYPKWLFRVSTAAPDRDVSMSVPGGVEASDFEQSRSYQRLR